MILNKEISNKFKRAGSVNLQFDIKSEKSVVIYSNDDICKDITIKYISENHRLITKKFQQKTCSVYSDNVTKENICLYISVFPVYSDEEITTLCVFSDFTKSFFSMDELKNLLSMSTHDILNCLSIINMANDRIITKADDNILSYCNIIKDNIYKTIRYNNSARDLISLYLNINDKELINTEISSFVKSHYTEIQKLLKDTKIEIQKEDVCYSRINSTLLSSALLNIFSNAVKYKSEASDIFVSVEKTYTYAKITVSNYVDTDDSRNLKRIFDLGYTTADGETKKGNGQGLYLAKKIAEFHDGKISAKIKDNLFSITLSLPKSNIKLNRLSAYSTEFNVANIRAYFDKM